MSSISPASIVAGSSAQTLTLSGTGFLAASTVQFNGAALPATFVSATTLQVQVGAAALASGAQVPLTVTNPAPGGGASPAFGYNVTSPTPLVKALSPQSVAQGVSATVTVTGTGFEANSQAQWNGSSRPTVFVNSTTLQVALTAQDTQKFGAGQITINNPGPGGSATTPVQLAVLAATPTITSVSPSSVAVNATSNVPEQVFLTGSGFAANATVQANGQAVSVSNPTATSITISLPAGDLAKAGSISLVVTNPGSPAVSSNTGVLSVVAPAAAISISPNFAPAGSPDTPITVSTGQANGFFADSVVEWNGRPLATKYVSSDSLTAVIPAALLAGSVQANVSVSSPEAATQAPAQPFDTYLALPTNDIIYNRKDGLIYASTPGSAGPSLGNSIVAIDPQTGVIQKTIFVGSEPNRVAISDDGTTLFAGLNGAAAIREVDLQAGTAGVQASLGGGTAVYAQPPFTAKALAPLPDQPHSVAVVRSDGGVVIYDDGAARSKQDLGNSIYQNDGGGALAFGGSASTLFYAVSSINGYLDNLTVGNDGVTADTHLTIGNFGNTLQFDNGRLYPSSGLVFDAANGTQLGQFSSIPSYSNTPVATAGPIVSESALNRAWIIPFDTSSTGRLLAFDEKTFNPVDSLALTGVGQDSPFNGGAADLIRWGQNGLAFRTATQVYILQGSLVKDVSGTPANFSVAVQAPGTASTGTAASVTYQVANLGPNQADGATLTITLPSSVILGSVHAGAGTCSGSATIYCDLGSIAGGASVPVTVSLTPTTGGTLQTTAHLTSASYDPTPSDNQADAAIQVAGNLFSAPPTITQLSPSLAQAGSKTLTLTVNGAGFSSASTVMWNGTALPTTLKSSGQLTAAVDASLVKSMGWAQVSVFSAAPAAVSLQPFLSAFTTCWTSRLTRSRMTLSPGSFTPRSQAPQRP